MNSITWKRIPNYDLYEASNTGLIRSTNYKKSGKIQILKPGLSPDGYLKTMLLNNQGSYNTLAIHKLITLTFFGVKPKGLEINHKNGIKTDNRIKNLEYITRSKNIKHAYDNGLMKPKKGSLNGMAKLTEIDVKAIRQHRIDYGRNYGRKELAERYGISESQIKDIINRRRNIWSHV